jgi:hypothetical protein
MLITNVLMMKDNNKNHSSKKEDYISLIGLNILNIIFTISAFSLFDFSFFVCIFLILTYSSFPIIDYLRQIPMGKLGFTLEETILGSILNGVKKSTSSKTERYTFLSYILWVFAGVVIMLIAFLK